MSKKPDEQLVKAITDVALMNSSSSRDATGLAWFQGGAVHGTKGGLPASEFIPKLYQKIPKDVGILICHTRNQTRGSHLVNSNNHPVNKDGIFLVHNGVVYPREGIQEEGVVDTMMLVEAAAKGNNLKEGIVNTSLDVSGSYACAVLSNREPDTLFLYRHGSPLYLSYLPTLETIFFATAIEDVEDALAEYKPLLGGLFNKRIYPTHYNAKLAEDTLLILRGNLTWESCKLKESPIMTSSWLMCKKCASWHSKSDSCSYGYRGGGLWEQ